MKHRISDALKVGVEKLSNKERPRLEAEILLAFILGVERIYLHTHCDEFLKDWMIQDFVSKLERLQQDEPIEYLIGSVSFYGYRWRIQQGVLIPRPETEILIERASLWIEQYKINRVFELGVGSGVISIMLALLHPNLEIIGSDINPRAISLSQVNLEDFAQNYDQTLKNRVKFHQIDVLSNRDFFLGESFDLLISNPPYIANHFPLPANVQYEPKDALFGGDGGEEMLYALVDLAQEMRIPYLACEMGYDQREKMSKKLKDSQYLEFYQDLSGLDRGFLSIL
ncbi:HemK/PrmC family methyltransferase [Helicobacter pametensis]|uniref:HemK/PrmC family methyltransferase n=1 Tax=Helicobacter pametensis TaxID=95149 RepID=UPI0004B7C728|nr:HemK/PrmC family methyltransferase [Helicobacter pametensis]